MDDFGYDSNGDGGAFDFTGRMTTDPEDFMSSSGATYYWSSAHITAPEVSGNDSWGYYGVGIDGQIPENGQWIAYKNVDWNIWPSPPPALPVAAESDTLIVGNLKRSKTMIFPCCVRIRPLF